MRAKLTALILLVGTSLVLGGCATTKRYHYQDIKREYQGLATQPVAERGGDQSLPAAGGNQLKLSGKLSLERAIELALANNPDQDMAVARIRQSEALVDQAMAPFYPWLSLYGGYTIGDAPSAYLFKLIDQRRLAPRVDFNHPGGFENYEVGIRAQWNLFRGGRDLLRRRMAETGLEISRLGRRSVQNALVASVTKAFYNCLASREFIVVAKKSVGTVQKQLSVMQVRYRAGGVLRSDVLSLEVRLARARENLVTARKNHQLALAALANLLGADPDADFELEDRPGPAAKVPVTYARGLSVALKRRPELLTARRRVEQARMGLDMVRGEYLPSLNANANYYWDAPHPGDLRADYANWTAGLLLNWNLFTGLSTRAGESKARAFLEQMLAADRKAALQVQLDVKSAYLNLAEAQARVEVSRASVARAEESLKLVSRQYQGGSADITRYLNAELALTRARIRAIAARYDREKALADIARALGLWTEGRKEGK